MNSYFFKTRKLHNLDVYASGMDLASEFSGCAKIDLKLD